MTATRRTIERLKPPFISATNGRTDAKRISTNSTYCLFGLTLQEIQFSLGAGGLAEKIENFNDTYRPTASFSELLSFRGQIFKHVG
jgi:hypothetical protein